MADIAYVYVDEQTISSALYCPICLDILQEPHTHVHCDSAFCRSCLLQLAEPLCPICRYTWNGYLPLEYNHYLPKASRLIRNMLDDLRVQCIYCHTIRRRGQFEHDCEPIDNSGRLLKLQPISERPRFENFSRWIFILVSILWFILVYFNRENLVQSATIDQRPMIHHVAMNLDDYFLLKTFEFVTNLFSYSMIALVMNTSLWLGLKCYGEHYVSKTTSRWVENVFETSIILNLLICSIYR